MAGITLKKEFPDEALFISGEVGVMMGLIRRVFLRTFAVAFGRKRHLGKAHILYYCEDARDIVLAGGANAKQELRNWQCYMDLLRRFDIP